MKVCCVQMQHMDSTSATRTNNRILFMTREHMKRINKIKREREKGEKQIVCDVQHKKRECM